jgi:hypothetical protein
VLTAAMYISPTWATLIPAAAALLPLASLVVLVVLLATRDKRPPQE